MHKVREFAEGKGPTTSAPEQQPTIAPTPSMQPTAARVRLLPHYNTLRKHYSSFQAQTKVQSDISKFFEPIIIKDPPSDYEFMMEPPSISAYELYVSLIRCRDTHRSCA